MNYEDFHKYGVHFCNLNEEQIAEKFDFDAVSELNDEPIIKKALLLLSQYLVGNITETLEEIHGMRIENRRKVFRCWIDIIKDADELRSICRSIIEDYI